jgi:hypothetical protein
VSGGLAVGSSYAATAVSDGDLITTGRIGLGNDTFKTWSAGFNSIQSAGGTNQLMLATTVGNGIAFVNNAYYNGGWKAVTTGRSTNISQASGEMYFRTSSGSGTADSAITWIESIHIDTSGNVGIGTTTPSSVFSVGSSSQFQVNTSGDIVKLKNLTYSWPSSHTTNGFLQDDGSGTLSWTTTVPASSVALSSITAATGTNTINNADYNQIWNWNSLTTGPSFTFGSSSTAGTASGTSTVLSIGERKYGVYVYHCASGTIQGSLFSRTHKRKRERHCGSYYLIISYSSRRQTYCI